jgi:acetyltransferase-like isoleucine patch superfamily enzyme
MPKPSLAPTARAWFNRLRRRCVRVLLYRIVFGERSASGELRPGSRISPATCIEHEDRLHLGEHVYIGPFNFLEASGGIRLGDGVQITSHCSVVTHSSHRSLRLLGAQYSAWPGPGPRPGWVAGAVEIGAYSFIGPHSLIEAGTRLGQGSLVCAGSQVRGHFPDFAVLAGRPAQVVGDTRHADAAWLARHPAEAGWHAGPEVAGAAKEFPL